MHALLDRYAGIFDFIIIDLPPVNIVADALVISSWSDGLVAVVRQNSSARQALRACVYQVRPPEANALRPAPGRVQRGGGAGPTGTLGLQRFEQLQAHVHVLAAVVNAGENVAVEIDHRSSAESGSSLCVSTVASIKARSFPSFVLPEDSP